MVKKFIPCCYNKKAVVMLTHTTAFYYSFQTIICCLPPLSEAKGPGIILSVWFSPIKSLLKSISFPLLSSKFCCGKLVRVTGQSFALQIFRVCRPNALHSVPDGTPQAYKTVHRTILLRFVLPWSSILSNEQKNNTRI